MKSEAPSNLRILHDIETLQTFDTQPSRRNAHTAPLHKTFNTSPRQHKGQHIVFTRIFLQKTCVTNERGRLSP
jgi:hypothetical protein